MKQEIVIASNETPIVCVLIVLGLLSYLAIFIVADLHDKSSLVFDVTTIAGFICGFCSLPFGLKLSNIKLNEERIVMAKITS